MENYSKKQIVENIPEHIINMYKISGSADVSYQKYLKSKNKFEIQYVDENLEVKSNDNSLAKIKNQILDSYGDETVELVNKALENNDIEIQRLGASLIERVPLEKQSYVRNMVSEKVFNALNNPNIQVQRIGMNMLQFCSPDKMQELKDLVSSRVREGLDSDDIEIYRVMAKKINLVPEAEQDQLKEILYKKLIKTFSQENITSQRLASTLIKYVSADKQESLKHIVEEKFNLAKNEGKIEKIVEPLFYLNSNKSETNSSFSRESFSKTGSGTTLLLGDKFQNNLILRHIETACFIAWKKAYENHEAWTSAGFDYVPIEPIYGFNKDESTNNINVASGVLDLNLEEWYAFSSNTFKEQLDNQKNLIVSTLLKMGINHGHPNDANFCLRFHRDANGNIDLENLPRIYIIDFDKAVLVEGIQ